jgi:hypothetical protein
MVDEQKKPELKKSEQTDEEKLFEQQAAEQKKADEKSQKAFEKEIAEHVDLSLVQQGIDLKKKRADEDALIKLAEEYLAKQEKEAKDS